MIEVRIFINDSEAGRIRISNMQLNPDSTAHYQVEFAVDRIGAIGLHTRVIQFFPRLKYNVLALVLQALNTLTPKELELEPGTDPSDMAWKVRGIGSAFPTESPDPIGDY